MVNCKRKCPQCHCDSYHKMDCSQVYQLKKLFDLIDKADSIYESDREWEDKYDQIFDMRIGSQISQLGYRFDWYDPDSSYEEDVTYYMNALRDWKRYNKKD